MSQLVTALLLDHVKYEDNDIVCETADTIHDHFHTIISNWSLEKEEEKQDAEVIQIPPPVPESSTKEISFESDSKPSSKSRGHREQEEIRYIC